jgi:hypothetical protein
VKFVRLPVFSAARGVGLALSAVAATACRPESPVRSSGEYALVSAVVYGRVLTAAGAPVPDVTVRANVHGSDDSCRPGGPGLTGGGPVTTEADGRYRQKVWAPVAPAEMCVSAVATPAAGTGLSAAGVGGVRVQMRPDPGPLDSARADIRLP